MESGACAGVVAVSVGYGRNPCRRPLPRPAKRRATRPARPENGASLGPRTGQVVALEPEIGDVLERRITEADGGDEGGIDRIDDGGAAGADGAEALGEVAVVEHFQDSAAVE